MSLDKIDLQKYIDYTGPKIGVTEAGDAGLDLSWKDKLDSVDCAILITKNLNDKFIDAALNAHEEGCPFLIHMGCTGFGAGPFEPNVPTYAWQLTQARKLIDSGFPQEQCVLRCDPLFPTARGFSRLEAVLSEAKHLGLFPMRCRVSIYDEYPHVEARLRKAGFSPLYGERKYATDEELTKASLALDALGDAFGITFETCAEPKLSGKHIIHQGCVSAADLAILGVATPNVATINPQNRHGCFCLCGKRELLKNRCRCPHGCIYCYWKD